MSKYYGFIGFLAAEEDSDGNPTVFPETSTDVYAENINEKPYFGDILRDTRKWQGSEHLNDNLNVSNRISILADPYAFENFHSIKYVTWLGTKWKVKAIEVAFPRLILDIGGVYNEHEQTT